MKVASLCFTLLFSVATAALADEHAEDVVPQDATFVDRNLLREAQEAKSDHVQNLEQDLLLDVPEDIESEGNSPRRDLGNYYRGGYSGGYNTGVYRYNSGESYGYRGEGTGNVYRGGYSHRYSGGGHGYNGDYNYGERYVSYPTYSGGYGGYRGGGYNYGYRGGYRYGKSKGKGMGYYRK